MVWTVREVARLDEQSRKHNVMLEDEQGVRCLVVVEDPIGLQDGDEVGLSSDPQTFVPGEDPPPLHFYLAHKATVNRYSVVGQPQWFTP